jgi:hypothetical protein
MDPLICDTPGSEAEPTNESVQQISVPVDPLDRASSNSGGSGSSSRDGSGTNGSGDRVTTTSVRVAPPPPPENIPKFKHGQRVVYINVLTEEKSFATITNIEYDYDGIAYEIEVVGEKIWAKEENLDLFVVDPAVNKVLGILNLCDETNKYLKANYPTLKEFEDFLKLPFEVVKDASKENGNY